MNNKQTLLELYKTSLFDEIKDWWKNLYSQPPRMDEFYNRLDHKSPWFGDMWNFFFENRHMDSEEEYRSLEFTDASDKTSRGNFDPEAIFKCFPKSLRESFDQLACELDYLFTETNYTKKFLPVILTAYSMNRRIPANSTEPSLISELYYGTGTSIRFNKRSGILLLRKLKLVKEANSKPSQAQCLDMARASYAKCFIFLTFLVHTAQLCNVSASFLVFEAMTNYLHYFEDGCQEILEKLEWFSADQILEDDPCKDQICEYAHDVVSDFWGWYSDRPTYEANKVMLEAFRTDCRSLESLPEEVKTVLQKEYCDLTFTEKEGIVRSFYKGDAKGSNMGHRLSYYFQWFASNLQEELTGKPYYCIVPVYTTTKDCSVYDMDEKDLQDLSSFHEEILTSSS